MIRRSGSMFQACLSLQIRIVRKQMLALLAMGLAALFLSVAIMMAAGQLFAGHGFGILRIAVASEEGSEQLDAMLDLLTGMKDVRKFAEISRAEVEDVEGLVRNGSVNAAVILPRGFADSLMSGENLPPRLVVDTARPLETMLTIQLAENVARMLVTAQQAVGYAGSVYLQQSAVSPALHSVIMDINMTFGFWVLQRGAMFHLVEVNPTGELGITQHYLLTALLFFCLLCVPVLYPLFARQEQRGWLLRLQGAGLSRALWYTGQIVIGALALTMLLALLLLGTMMFGNGVFSLWALPGLLLSGLFLSCFGWLMCNVGGPLPSVSLIFLLSLAFWVTSGGLLPEALLPKGLAGLSFLSPVTWMRDTLAPLFGARGAIASLAALPAACVVLIALGALLSKWEERLAGRRASS